MAAPARLSNDASSTVQRELCFRRYQRFESQQPLRCRSRFCSTVCVVVCGCCLLTIMVIIIAFLLRSIKTSQTLCLSLWANSHSSLILEQNILSRARAVISDIATPQMDTRRDVSKETVCQFVPSLVQQPEYRPTGGPRTMTRAWQTVTLPQLPSSLAILGNPFFRPQQHQTSQCTRLVPRRRAKQRNEDECRAGRKCTTRMRGTEKEDNPNFDIFPPFLNGSVPVSYSAHVQYSNTVVCP